MDEIKFIKRAVVDGYVIVDRKGNSSFSSTMISNVKRLIGEDNFEYFKNTFNMSNRYFFICIFENEDDISRAVEYLLPFLIMSKIIGDD